MLGSIYGTIHILVRNKKGRDGDGFQQKMCRTKMTLPSVKRHRTRLLQDVHRWQQYIPTPLSLSVYAFHQDRHRVATCLSSSRVRRANACSCKPEWCRSNSRRCPCLTACAALANRRRLAWEHTQQKDKRLRQPPGKPRFVA